MAFIPSVGGLGSATIAGALYSKLTPATIMWQPQGTRGQVAASSKNEVASNSAGTTSPDSETRDAPIRDAWNDVTDTRAAAVQKLVFHCIEKEGYSISNAVTEFPVDSGFAVSDHVIRQNPIISIEGVVSNMPMEAADLTSLEGIIQVGGAIIGSPLAGILASSIGLGKALTNDQQANVDHFHTQLDMLVKTGQLVTISTLRGLYHNCVVINYNTSATADTSASLHFSATLKRLNIVNAKGEKVLQTNQSLTELPKLGKERVEGFAKSIGIGVIGSVL